MRDLVAIGGVAIFLGGVFAGLRWWQTRRRERSVDPEMTRKAAHVAGGMIAMTFPWVFQQTWPVMVACGISLAAMLILHFVPIARDSIGRVTGSVERRSFGELYFPIGVAATWLISQGEPVLFVIPIAFLTFADTAAALVGKAYGARRFRTSEGSKSVEGSVAFFATGFVITCAGLSLLRDVPWAETLLIATLLGLMLMMSEAISWRGLDNLILPVAAAALLDRYLGLSVADLLWRLGVLGAITLGLLCWKRRTTLIGEGVLASALYLYGAWALGGRPYLLSPLLLLVLLPMLHRVAIVPRVTIHGVGVVLALCAPGLVCIALASRDIDMVLPYSIAFAASAGVALVAPWHAEPTRWPRIVVLVGAIVGGTLIGCGPRFALTPFAGWKSAWAFLAVGAAMLAMLLAYAPMLVRLTAPFKWIHRGAAIAVGAAAGAIGGLILEGRLA